MIFYFKIDPKPTHNFLFEIMNKQLQKTSRFLAWFCSQNPQTVLFLLTFLFFLFLFFRSVFLTRPYIFPPDLRMVIADVGFRMLKSMYVVEHHG